MDALLASSSSSGPGLSREPDPVCRISSSREWAFPNSYACVASARPSVLCRVGDPQQGMVGWGEDGRVTIGAGTGEAVLPF